MFYIVEQVQLDVSDVPIGIIVGDEQGNITTRYSNWIVVPSAAKEKIEQWVYDKLPQTRANQFKTPFGTVIDKKTVVLTSKQFDFWVALQHEVSHSKSPLKFQTPVRTEMIDVDELFAKVTNVLR